MFHKVFHYIQFYRFCNWCRGWIPTWLETKEKEKKGAQTNLSINQSKTKKYKISYGDTVKIKKCDSDEIIELEESTCEEIHDVKEHVTRVECSEEVSKKLEGGDDINEIEIQNEYTSELNINAKPDGDSVSYLERCKRICQNELISAVIDQFDKEGLLIHFMAFMNMISTGQLSIVNMEVLLSIEVALLFSLAMSTQMRYREDTSLFWEVVLAVGGPRTLWLFSSDKHTDLVNSGECMKSRYEPNKGSFNFAVPDERLLRKSQTGLPKVIKCGIIHESILLLNLEKEFVLSVDGKQTSPGLLNESEGDVNLWIYEGPPSLEENFEHLQENVIIEVVNKASRKTVISKMWSMTRR